MWGAIIGDLAGSIYEYDQLKEIKSVNPKEIIPENAFFSDDTILTIAISEAVQKDQNYDKYLRKYGNIYIDYKPKHKPYFKSSFSPGFTKWCKSNEIGESVGNGAMMRISPVGFYFNTEEKVRENAKFATIPSHNSKEAIVYSTLTALIIFYARNGMNKDEILNKLNLKLKYNDFEKFNTTCHETFDNCVYAVFTSKSFEESIYKILSYGGDTDTNACIVGAMAEAMYGINPVLTQKVKTFIPDEFVKIIENMYKVKQIEEFEK